MYQEREIRKLPVKGTDGVDWKRYLIRYDNSRPADELIGATDRVSSEAGFLESPRPLHNAGFVIMHAGADMDFVLFGYWVNTNELVLNVYKSPPGRSTELSRADTNRSSIACVWDLAVVCYERDAWVKHILRPPVPDREAYLYDQVEGMI